VVSSDTDAPLWRQLGKNDRDVLRAVAQYTFENGAPPNTTDVVDAMQEQGGSLTTAYVSQILSRLEDRGMLSREQNPDRTVDERITPTGQQTLADLRSEWESISDFDISNQATLDDSDERKRPDGGVTTRQTTIDETAKEITTAQSTQAWGISTDVRDALRQVDDHCLTVNSLTERFDTTPGVVTALPEVRDWFESRTTEAGGAAQQECAGIGLTDSGIKEIDDTQNREDSK
jgi:DNA-binding MarR family transcriptional regulator